MAIDREAIKKHIRGILIALGDDPDRGGPQGHTRKSGKDV